MDDLIDQSKSEEEGSKEKGSEEEGSEEEASEEEGSEGEDLESESSEKTDKPEGYWAKNRFMYDHYGPVSAPATQFEPPVNASSDSVLSA